MSISVAAARLRLPRSFVYTIIDNFEWDGSLTRKPRRLAPPPKKMTITMDEWAWAKLDEMPMLTLELLTEALNNKFQSQISVSTVCRHLNHAVKEDRYRLKLCRYEPEDYNAPGWIEAQKLWCENFVAEGLNLNDAIFLDEAGFNLHLTRRKGHARTGHMPLVIQPTQRGQNVTLVVAMGLEGILASTTQFGSFKSADFDNFVREKVLPQLAGRERGPMRVFILDNARIHIKQHLAAIIDGQAKLKFLPSYSPQLNAAEWVFGNVKPYIKQQDLRQGMLLNHVADGINRIDGGMTSGWIREVQCNFVMALQGLPLGKLYSLRLYRELPQFAIENEVKAEENVEE